MPEKPVHAAFLALVRGRVQGVGFRYETRSLARSLGLSGWVKNLDDGGVEVYAEGPPTDIARMKAWLAKGPPGALVSTLDISDRVPRGVYSTFSVED